MENDDSSVPALRGTLFSGKGGSSIGGSGSAIALPGFSISPRKFTPPPAPRMIPVGPNAQVEQLNEAYVQEVRSRRTETCAPRMMNTSPITLPPKTASQPQLSTPNQQEVQAGGSSPPFRSRSSNNLRADGTPSAPPLLHSRSFNAGVTTATARSIPFKLPPLVRSTTAPDRPPPPVPPVSTRPPLRSNSGLSSLEDQQPTTDSQITTTTTAEEPKLQQRPPIPPISTRPRPPTRAPPEVPTKPSPRASSITTTTTTNEQNPNATYESATTEITETTYEATSVDLSANESIPDLEEEPTTSQTENNNNNNDTTETTNLADQPIFDSTYDEYDDIKFDITGTNLERYKTSLSGEGRQRQMVIDEVLTTEEDYVNDLELTINLYLKPMREKKILESRALATLFSNIEMLYNLNKQFLSEFKKRLRASLYSNMVHFGDIFKRMADYFKMYTVYCANQQDAVKTLEESKKVTAFVNFVKETEKDPSCRGLTLYSFLIKPVQRVCKYPLFIKDLLKHTPKESPDYGILQESLVKLDEIVTHINEGTRRIENQQKVLEIQKKIELNEKLGVCYPLSLFAVLVCSIHQSTLNR
eukprot:TRINITY_DN1814_c0_g2_i2.p1 TRINITY_DN1814_c0_g2~~TRINITY_DN1814_c0_g2_i2.p1  ORF type:complete len:586 (+),score=123.34 TRINITY_DN1814_c0_g2_i2:84-1841(+)